MEKYVLDSKPPELNSDEYVSVELVNGDVFVKKYQDIFWGGVINYKRIKL